MPQDITQKLGFDASKAIQELTRLRGELNNFKQSLQSTSGALRKFSTTAMPAVKTFRTLSAATDLATRSLLTFSAVSGTPIETLSQRVTRASGIMTNLGAATKTTGAAVSTASSKITTSTKPAATALTAVGVAGKTAAKDITVSWSTMVRVIQTQLIVRALSTIISAFKDAHDAARDFSVSVAEVSTLSGTVLGNLDQMSSSTKELAISLGSDAGEVAAGVYQTLSNQVVKTGESFQFTNVAAKLAIATQAELETAVDALSSVINSYNLDASEAGRVSDVLFHTVDLGRLKLEEFGSVIGRVTPLTAALGISYTEMAAAIAALTQKGVPAHTAITQLTQVSQKLLRPTEKLQALYHEWGVKTGAEAISRFGGLQGVLLKMKDATAGNDTAFADLLGRVRAIVGALNLTSDSANALDAAMRQMTEGVGITDEAFKKIRESAGRQSVEAWNNLSTAMLEAGDVLLEITTPAAKALTYLASGMKTVAQTAILAGGAILLLKMRVIMATAQVGALALATKGVVASLALLGPVALTVIAAFLAVKIGQVWADWADTATESAERIAAAEKAMADEHERQTLRMTENIRAEFADQTKYANQHFTLLSQMYRKDASDFETRSEVIGAVFEDTLANLMQQRKAAVKMIKDAVLDADRAIEASAKRQATAQGKLDELNFDRRTRKLSKQAAGEAKHQRANIAAQKAAAAFAAAGANEEAQAAAMKLSQLAETRAAADIAHQESLKNSRGKIRAEKTYETILKQRIKNEKNFQEERGKLRDAAHKDQLAKLIEAGKAYDILLKKMKDLADPTDKTEPQRLEDAKLLKELLPEIAKSLEEAFDFDAFKSLGLPKGIEQLKFGIAEAFDKAKFDWTKAANDFGVVLASKKYKVPVMLEITNEGFLEQIEKRIGKVDSRADPGRVGGQRLKIAQDIVELAQKSEAATSQAAKKIAEAVKTVHTLPSADALGRGFSLSLPPKRLEGVGYKEFLDQIKNAPKDIEALRQKVISLADDFDTAAKTGGKLPEDIKTKYNEAYAEGKKLADQELISKGGVKHLVNMFNQIQKMNLEWEKILEARKAGEAIKPGAAEAALDIAVEQGKESKNLVLTAELLGLEMKEVANNIAAAKEAQDNLNSSIEEGARKAAKPTDAKPIDTKPIDDSWEITQQPDVGEWVDSGALDIAAQVTAAQQLKTEMLAVNAQFSQISTSARGLEALLSASTEPAFKLGDSFGVAGRAAHTISTAMPLIVGQLIAAASPANILMKTLIQSASAARATNQATVSLTSSLGAAASAASGLKSAMLAAASAAEAAARACRAAAKACSGGGVSASTGGRFFAAGGRGTDTIPAMLTPGEFVINAKSARDFFPQLQAINAGQAPVYRDQGGSVTNIGDVNVTLQGGEGPPAQTVREIATGLRRELRRKTVKLY